MCSPNLTSNILRAINDHLNSTDIDKFFKKSHMLFHARNKLIKPVVGRYLWHNKNVKLSYIIGCTDVRTGKKVRNVRDESREMRSKLGDGKFTFSKTRGFLGVMYSLSVSNFRMIVSISVVLGATNPLLTGIINETHHHTHRSCTIVVVQ